MLVQSIKEEDVMYKPNEPVTQKQSKFDTMLSASRLSVKSGEVGKVMEPSSRASSISFTGGNE